MSNFLLGLVKSLLRTEVKNMVNDSRKWECSECSELKTHRAQKFDVNGKPCCVRCKRKLVG